MTEPEVLDAAESSRFEIHVDGTLAGFAVYRLGHDRISFIHTEIDDAFAGQGLGGTLVRAALDAARTRNLAVIPRCPFVRSWIHKHEDYLGVVPEAERSRVGLR